MRAGFFVMQIYAVGRWLQARIVPAMTSSDRIMMKETCRIITKLSMRGEAFPLRNFARPCSNTVISTATPRAVWQWCRLSQLHATTDFQAPTILLFISSAPHHPALSSRQSPSLTIASLLYERPTKLTGHNELFTDAANTPLSGSLR